MESENAAVRLERQAFAGGEEQDLAVGQITRVEIIVTALGQLPPMPDPSTFIS